MRARELFSATVVDPDRIHAVEADIYAPCALGGAVNPDSIGQIRAGAVAGGANNQLASADLGERLQARGILFAPDYVINAGGVIGAVEEIAAIPGRNLRVSEPVAVRLCAIHDRLLDIFERSDQERSTPEATALRMAKELIAR
jgi:leucine dehydrogenase